MGLVEKSLAKKPGSTITGWPSPQGALLRKGNAAPNALSSINDLPSLNIWSKEGLGILGNTCCITNPINGLTIRLS
jgi:hypothetical protein